LSYVKCTSVEKCNFLHSYVKLFPSKNSCAQKKFEKPVTRLFLGVQGGYTTQINRFEFLFLVVLSKKSSIILNLFP